MRLIKACIAMAAFAAIFVVPSVASAIQLTHPTGTTTPTGTLLLATNVKHSNTELTTIMKTGVGNVECETATLTGELTKNEANGAAVEGNITTAEFYGKPGQTPPHPAGQKCAGGFGGDTAVTPNHTINSCHTPSGGTEHCSLPWCLKAGAENTFTVRGGKCNETPRPLTFTLHTEKVGTCSYQKASVTGTYTTHPADAIGTITAQKFERTTGIFCPASGELFMAFTLGTDPKDTEPFYIDLK
jgi:hypothetical protein